MVQFSNAWASEGSFPRGELVDFSERFSRRGQKWRKFVYSDVVETVTSETETETWLKFRDETETLS